MSGAFVNKTHSCSTSAQITSCVTEALTPRRWSSLMFHFLWDTEQTIHDIKIFNTNIYNSPKQLANRKQGGNTLQWQTGWYCNFPYLPCGSESSGSSWRMGEGGILQSTLCQMFNRLGWTVCWDQAQNKRQTRKISCAAALWETHSHSSLEWADRRVFPQLHLRQWLNGKQAYVRHVNTWLQVCGKEAVVGRSLQIGGNLEESVKAPSSSERIRSELSLSVYLFHPEGPSRGQTGISPFLQPSPWYLRLFCLTLPCNFFCRGVTRLECWEKKTTERRKHRQNYIEHNRHQLWLFGSSKTGTGTREDSLFSSQFCLYCLRIAKHIFMAHSWFKRWLKHDSL